ncbi:MAG: phosphoglycerate mutase family protein [Candidatus Thiodiazotropha sp. (ex Semelilucina semeliformis)]|nr:phosphoglycerate mutase family protein [Candidatus Thiodiazotropha sp. (ex Semelilucina semeliformis)]
MNKAPRVIAALLRHGDYHQLPNTPSALQPFPLTQHGVEQAQRAVGLLQRVLTMFGWSVHPVIDSSRLLRGYQTAEVIARGLLRETSQSTEIVEFDALAERSLGAGCNLTLQQIERVIASDPRYHDLPVDWKSNSHFRLPLQGAESLMQAGQRVAVHIDNRLAELQTEVEQDTVKLFVGHGAAFRHAAHHLGVIAFDQIAALSMYHCRPVFLERRFVGDWHHLTGEWKVRSKGESFAD